MPVIAKPRTRRLPAKGTTNSTPAKSAQRSAPPRRSDLQTARHLSLRHGGRATPALRPPRVHPKLENRQLQSAAPFGATSTRKPLTAHLAQSGPSRRTHPQPVPTARENSEAPPRARRPSTPRAQAAGNDRRATSQTRAPTQATKSTPPLHTLTKATTRSGLLSTSKKPSTHTTRRNKRTTTYPITAKSTHA